MLFARVLLIRDFPSHRQHLSTSGPYTRRENIAKCYHGRGSSRHGGRTNHAGCFEQWARRRAIEGRRTLGVSRERSVNVGICQRSAPGREDGPEQNRIANDMVQRRPPRARMARVLVDVRPRARSRAAKREDGPLMDSSSNIRIGPHCSAGPPRAQGWLDVTFCHEF